MKHSMLCSTALIASLTSSFAFSASCPEILNGKQRLLNSNEEIELCDEFQGKTLLIVNTASQCGFTPQFEQLEQLHQTYKDEGFTVVGFPSNDFRQDRGSEEQSAKICYLDYGVTFPMMARASLSGPNANPVFAEIPWTTITSFAPVASMSLIVPSSLPSGKLTFNPIRSAQ